MRTPRSTPALRLAIAVVSVLAAAVPATAAGAPIQDGSGVAIPNTETARNSTTAQLVGEPTVVQKLYEPFSPADDDPAVLAELGSTGSPEDDLAAALDGLANAPDRATARALRRTALSILDGSIAGKPYSGIPLLNWNMPAKVKTVPAGGNVVIREVRFDDHVVSDTAFLSFEDPSQPFTITYRVTELGTTFGGELAPTPLLEDASGPLGGLNSVLLPLDVPNTPTGTFTSGRFHPNGEPEMTRLTVQDVTVAMPPPGTVRAILEPNLKPAREALGMIAPETPATDEALRAAFGFTGDAPTAAEKSAAIKRLAPASPERQLYTDLARLDPKSLMFFAAARTVGAQDASLVAAMRLRWRIPAGVSADPSADVVVTLMNDEAYVSTRSVRLGPGAPLRVAVVNRDRFAHTFQAVDLTNRTPIGADDWGRFDWAELALDAPAELAAGASRTFTLTPAASSFALWLGDPLLGDQAGMTVSIDHSPLRQSFQFRNDFDDPSHAAMDQDGNVWVTLLGSDTIARLHPSADLASAQVDRVPLANGRFNPNSAAVPLEPHDVAVDARGIVWATLAGGNAIARIDPSGIVSGTPRGSTIYDLAPCDASVCVPPFPPPPPGTPLTRGPEQMAVMEDGDGDTLVWFTEIDANMIGLMRFDADGTELASVDFDCGCLTPKGIALGADGSVWFTEEDSNRLGRLVPDQARPEDPSRARLLHYPIPSSRLVQDPGHPPTRTSAPHSLVIDPAGRIWWSEEETSQVGYLDPELATPGTSDGMTEIALGDNDFGRSVEPADIGVDRAGTVFFTDEYGDIVGSVTDAGVQERWRPAARISMTDKPFVDPAGNLWFTEGGAGLMTRISGVSAGAPLPAPPPAYTVRTDRNTLEGSGLRDAVSVDVEVRRDGTLVAQSESAAVVDGRFTLGDAGDPWDSSSGDPLRPGDSVTVTPHDPEYAMRALTFTVASLSASVAPDGSLRGTALSRGAPVADQVTVEIAGASATADIDPADGSFAYAPATRLGAGAPGTVAWTGATPLGTYRTVTGF